VLDSLLQEILVILSDILNIFYQVIL